MMRIHAGYILIMMCLLSCDNQALVEIIEPVDGSLVNGDVEIIARVASSYTLDSIEYYIDDELLGSATACSDTGIWQTNSSVHGSTHDLSAIGYLHNGLIVESDIISVTIYTRRTVLAEVFGEYC
jgi:hypothetical protein